MSRLPVPASTWDAACAALFAYCKNHQDGRLNRHGAGPTIALPEPDYLINGQDRDHIISNPAIVVVKA